MPLLRFKCRFEGFSGFPGVLRAGVEVSPDEQVSSLLLKISEKYLKVDPKTLVLKDNEDCFFAEFETVEFALGSGEVLTVGRKEAREEAKAGPQENSDFLTPPKPSMKGRKLSSSTSPTARSTEAPAEKKRRTDAENSHRREETELLPTPASSRQRSPSPGSPLPVISIRIPTEAGRIPKSPENPKKKQPKVEKGPKKQEQALAAFCSAVKRKDSPKPRKSGKKDEAKAESSERELPVPPHSSPSQSEVSCPLPPSPSPSLAAPHLSAEVVEGKRLRKQGEKKSGATAALLAAASEVRQSRKEGKVGGGSERKRGAEVRRSLLLDLECVEEEDVSSSDAASVSSEVITRMAEETERKEVASKSQDQLVEIELEQGEGELGTERPERKEVEEKNMEDEKREASLKLSLPLLVSSDSEGEEERKQTKEGMKDRKVELKTSKKKERAEVLATVDLEISDEGKQVKKHTKAKEQKSLGDEQAPLTEGSGAKEKVGGGEEEERRREEKKERKEKRRERKEREREMEKSKEKNDQVNERRKNEEKKKESSKEGGKKGLAPLPPADPSPRSPLPTTARTETPKRKREKGEEGGGREKLRREMGTYKGEVAKGKGKGKGKGEGKGNRKSEEKGKGKGKGEAKGKGESKGKGKGKGKGADKPSPPLGVPLQEKKSSSPLSLAPLDGDLSSSAGSD